MNNLSGYHVLQSMLVGSGLCTVGMVCVSVFVDVRSGLAVAGMPVKGRAVDGSEAQSIPAI